MIDTSEHWEDRLSKNGTHATASAAIDKFRKSRKGAAARDKLYNVLTSLEVTSEEAEEIVNLEMQDNE